MAEAPATPATEKPWREMSDKELALSFVEFNIKGIREKIKSTQSSLDFYRTYKSPISTVSRPSYVESGSMDDSDWNIAELEDEQFELEREDMIELYQGEVDELHDQFSQLDDDKDEIEDGNPDLIGKYSVLERERQEKLEENSKPK